LCQQGIGANPGSQDRASGLEERPSLHFVISTIAELKENTVHRVAPLRSPARNDTKEKKRSRMKPTITRNAISQTVVVDAPTTFQSSRLTFHAIS
jgi:hypothetical protein